MDDMVRMSSESQTQYYLIVLQAIYHCYGPKYLNKEPTLHQLRAIQEQYAQVGFPGCIGFVDCMHVHWKYCPKAMKGQYHNPKDGKLAIMSCEALCDRRLYCWYRFPVRCGTNYDITVVDNSPLFIDILSGGRRMTIPEGYVVNGVHQSGLLYYLVDGIYPPWSVFVGPNDAPLNDREANMTQRRESTRKDIERMFGALQGRFKILRLERHEWSDELIILISQACIILHNMLVEMDSNGELEDKIAPNGETVSVIEAFGEGANDSHHDQEQMNNVNFKSPTSASAEDLLDLLQTNELVTNVEKHHNLTTALSYHLWAMRGETQ
ncbi:Plant transposon protein [Gracilaria domingensis]|nr:Plant transposon protein [Gracilaria domingensis]